MNWLLQHWDELFAAWGILVALCTAVVRLTPTQKDDTFLAKIVKWADVFSVVFTKQDAKIIADALKKKNK